MKSYLEYTADPKIFLDLPPAERLQLELKSMVDPVFFWNHPKLGNFPLFPAKIDILNEMYKYDESGRRINSELLWAAGMRGGKSAGAGLITLTETYKLLMMKDPQKYYNLSPGAEIFNINTANSLEQAKDTVFKKVKEIVENSPYFAAQDPDLTATSLKFNKHITLKALGSNIGSNVGRTVKSFVADELDDYDDPEFVYDKLSKSTENFAKFGENVRVAIGSPSEDSILLNKIARAREEKWRGTITVWKPTWELNPNIPYDEEARRRNPIAYDRDFGAKPSGKRESFFNAALLKQVKERCEPIQNIFIGSPNWREKWGFTPQLDLSLVRPARDAIDYVIAIDPAIRHDAFGLSVGYLSLDDSIKIIGSTVFTALKGEEIETKVISDILNPICKMLPIRAMVFDIYMHTELHNIAKDNAIRLEQHNLDLKDWIIFRNDLYDGKATTPFSEYLFKEYRELLVINGKKVDHPRMGSKDQADADCQVASFFRREQEEARLNSNQVVSNYVARF